jgi:putative YhdH/YhfP family quinone oxidoreductase
VFDNGRFGAGRFCDMQRCELDAGEVVVRAAFASVNYKDALTARGRARIVRRFPCVAGIDVSGTVEASEDARFKPGDPVIVHSFGMAVEHDGGYAELCRFPADWVIPLPPGLTLFESMALGVAGHTAALVVEYMELNGLSPDKGKVLVNGATGGLASIAIDMLAGRGYRVVAMTGKPAQAEYLREIGASEVVGRDAFHDEGRALEAPLWAGAVDSVGGKQLAWLIRSMQRDGVIAAPGNAGGIEFAGNVLPFILRGVRLLGVNVDNPMPVKKRIWQRLASDLKPRHLDWVARRIRFDELERAFDELLAARVTGRYVVDFEKGSGPFSAGKGS